MHLLALYKTWDGEEWIEASLASIYDHVSSIVMVHSETSWLGERGNTVREPAMRWAEQHDREGKIHHVNVDCRSQEQQYAAGLDYIRGRLYFDAVLAIDSDEVWEGAYLEDGKEQVASDTKHQAYRCNMHSYLKTPFYRVHPPFGSPTVFFKKPELLTESPRGCRAEAMQLDTVWMHHYTYVRKSREDVWRKIQQSCQADGGEIIVENWLSNVYDHLPDGTNLHAFVRWRDVWKSITRVWWSDVPAAVRESEMMSHWWPMGLLIDGERNALFEIARGRRQVVDLGTFLGLSAVILSLAAERVYTVDAYEQVLSTGSFANIEDPGQYERLLREHQQSLGKSRQLFDRFGNITAEQCDTAIAGHRWPRQDVDLLFVDADHSAVGTMANVQAWWSKLLPGARIVFHDNNELHPGVQEAIRELEAGGCVRRLQLGQHSGSLAAFEKSDA